VSPRSGQQQVAPRIEVASQLGAVVVLEGPLLATQTGVALLHQQLVLALADGQALAGGAVVQLLRVLAEGPELERKDWVSDSVYSHLKARHKYFYGMMF